MIRVETENFQRRNREFLRALRQGTPAQKGLLAGMEKFRGYLIKDGNALNKGGRLSPRSPVGLRVISGNLRRSTTAVFPMRAGNSKYSAGIDFGIFYARDHITTLPQKGKRVTMRTEWEKYLKIGEFQKTFDAVLQNEIRKLERKNG